jgi:6-phosphogluconate dehydrogenase
LISSAYRGANQEFHLFEMPEIISEMKKSAIDLRKLVGFMSEQGVHFYALSAALSYFEAMTKKESSANMIQGLRDFFGAHTYQRKDQEGVFHTNWEV